MMTGWQIVPIINVRNPTWSVMLDDVQVGVGKVTDDGVTFEIDPKFKEQFQDWMLSLATRNFEPADGDTYQYMRGTK